MSTSVESEYAALRDTIRLRGTVRMVLGWITVAVWAVLATISFPPSPFTSLVQLLLLVAGFEAICALHLNVERIGRYLQVFHETPQLQAGSWEHASMAFGQSFPGTGTDPLSGAVFALAVLLNLAPTVLTRPDAVTAAVLTAAHVLLLGRIALARDRASRQRTEDLTRFEALRAEAAAKDRQASKSDGMDAAVSRQD